MMKIRIANIRLTALLTLALGTGFGSASAQTQTGAQRPESPQRRPARLLASVSDDLVNGDLLDIRGGPPWRMRSVSPTLGGRHLRRFGPDAYLVGTDSGTLQRIPLNGDPAFDFDLGADSEPQDIHLLQGDPRSALVTRRNDPRLLLIDTTTGVRSDATDLSPVGDGSPIALGNMIADGQHLFVQVKVTDAVPGGLGDGVLAVVDRSTLALIDVDPLAPGTQGIALKGAPPRLKMQIVERTLFVSATEGYLDGRGAIEMVDLDALTSIGFALSEQQVGDLGGFVMTSADAGYFVFHTDFAASTHLNTFSIAGGPVFGPEIVLLLGDMVDVLVHDPLNERLYLPSGFAGGPTGIYVVNTRTGTALPSGPILTDMRVRDVVLR